nr:ATP synthase F0 subunit 8 [Chydorus sphaericus]
MPQSWPSQWMLLFTYFSIIILLMIGLNFFIMSTSTQQTKSEAHKSSFYSWQW